MKKLFWLVMRFLENWGVPIFTVAAILAVPAFNSFLLWWAFMLAQVVCLSLAGWQPSRRRFRVANEEPPMRYAVEAEGKI